MASVKCPNREKGNTVLFLECPTFPGYYLLPYRYTRASPSSVEDNPGLVTDA